jgi:hypothetical protein
MSDSLEGSDLLSLPVPCAVPTPILEALVRSMYHDGTMQLGSDVLLPTLQLADAIQVRAPFPVNLT